MRRNKDFVIFAIIAAILVGAVWFFKIKSTPVSTIPTSARLQVTTSFYPLYFFATQIGGDKADIVNIIPTGVEPHDYEPSAQNIIEIENSKLLVLNGGGLEAWGEKIAKTIPAGHTLILTVGKDLITQTITEGGAAIIDPHVWLSPPLAKKMVDKIAAGFEQVDPTNATYYESNAQTLIDKLSTLDSHFQSGLANCEQTDIVTSHAAFGYLATAYHLNQVSIAGLSPDVEPSPKDLGAIIELVKKNNIKFIFFESLASPKLSETIARETGAQTLVLNPIEGLTPEEVATGKDYFTAMEQNLNNLQLALGCKK